MISYFINSFKINLKKNSNHWLKSISVSRSWNIKTIRKLKKWSNVYIELHYMNIVEKYRLSSQCNMLTEENKQHYFKKIVYNTTLLLKWDSCDSDDITFSILF